MDMKLLMKMLQIINVVILKIQDRSYFYIIKKDKGGCNYVKIISQNCAEKYAKTTNTACFAWAAFHQPKMPASLIKKD